jgi:hypothetical protein
MWINTLHVTVACCVLAFLDCLLTYKALTSTKLHEANLVQGFFIKNLGVIPGLLVLHYLPIAIAYYLGTHGNVNGWGALVDGCAIFGLVDIWDAWQLHKAGRM